jgi:hypothetical protein
MNVFKELAKFNIVKYHDAPHKYFIGEQELISGTAFIEQFKVKFDKQGTATKLAKKKNIPIDEVLSDWAYKGDFSRTKGTLLHNYAENYWQNKIYPYDDSIYTERFGEGAMQERLDACKEHFHNFYLKAKKNLIPVAMELVIGDAEIGIGGMVDCLFWNDKYNEYQIWDYKGLALDTDIPTKDGFKKMSEIQVGDIVFDGDGNYTTVENVSDIHYNPCYKIVFDTNEEIICDHEHRWEICSLEDKTQVVDTDAIFNIINNKEPVRIKNTCINVEEKELPIDPYVLGIWLGDGTKSCGGVTNMHKEVWDEIINRGYSIGDKLNPATDVADTRTIYGIQPHLKLLNVLNNKHIPDIYLRSSRAQRIDLLRGLMDSDGYFHKTRNRCVMNTTSLVQAKYYSELITSLGERCSIIPAKGSGFGKTNINCFHVSFKTTSFSPFLVRNIDYLDLINPKTKNAFRYVKSITKIDTVPTKCITVNSPLSTYLATRNYIKTHNTNKEINEFSKFRTRLKAPLNFLHECELETYSIQLNLYKYIIQKNTDIKIGKCFLVHIHEEQEDYNIIECKEYQEIIQLLINYIKKTK